MIFTSILTACLMPATLFASMALAIDFPAAGPCSGDCSGDLHDPSVIRAADGTYYRFTTNDEINIATAPSIAGPWTHQGAALPGGSSINLPGRTDLWAPDVYFYNGLYYLYYAVSTIGSQNSDIGVATSPSMAVGTWTDHGSVGIPSSSSWNKIDPNLFQHDPASPFLLTFGSFWGNIYQVQLANPPLTVANSAVNHVEQNTTGTNYNEGGYQFWWTVGNTAYYYLFFSSGDCCNTAGSLARPGDEYKVMVCRSTSPTSGFVDKLGNDCLTRNGGTIVYSTNSHDVYAPGGQGVFYDPGQGSVVMYYHYVKPSVGYDYNKFFFGWNKLDFSSGWPVAI